jgi:dihydrofolate reductase
VNADRPRLSLVVAVAENGVIGRDGGLPWHIPSDLKRFRAITMGHPLIMGRKTWDSLPKKPLPGRQNIVISRQKALNAPGADVVASFAEALEKARSLSSSEIHVIGGARVFEEALAIADRVYLTRIAARPEGDTFFPELDPAIWLEVAREAYEQGLNDTAAYALFTYDRKRVASRRE